MEHKINACLNLTRKTLGYNSFAPGTYKLQIDENLKLIYSLLSSLLINTDTTETHHITNIVDNFEETNTTILEPLNTPTDTSSALQEALEQVDSVQIHQSLLINNDPPIYNEHLPGHCKCDECNDYIDISNGSPGSETDDQ